jgi:hypothetical protein
MATPNGQMARGGCSATPIFESGLGHSYLAICGVRITLNGGWAKLSGLVVCEI